MSAVTACPECHWQATHTPNCSKRTYTASQVQETIRKDREWSCVLTREALSGFVASEELDALCDRIRNATMGDE